MIDDFSFFPVFPQKLRTFEASLRQRFSAPTKARRCAGTTIVMPVMGEVKEAEVMRLFITLPTVGKARRLASTFFSKSKKARKPSIYQGLRAGWAFF